MLVMVLALLAVGSLTLAGVARRSLQAAVQASAAQIDLQRRWGMWSCSRTLLAAAPQLLEAETAKLPPPDRHWPLPGSMSTEVTLGGIRFSLLLAEEEAKINLNSMLRRPDNGNRDLTALLEQTAGPNWGPVELRSEVAGAGASARQSIGSWGQIVTQTNGAGCPSEMAIGLRDATHDLTCWGSGKLDVRRASDPAVETFCRNQVGSDVIAKLLRRRHEEGIGSLNDLLTGLALRTEDRNRLEQLLTDRGQWHSLWIVAQTAQRSWALLALDGGRRNGTAVETFAW